MKNNMTETQVYDIAGHIVRIDFADSPRSAVEVAPSFQPFLTENNGKGDVVLHVIADSKYRPDTENLKKTGTFPSNDAEYSMFERSDKGVVFAFRDYDRSPMAVIDMEPDLKTVHVSIIPQDRRYIRVLASSVMVAYAFATSGLNTVAIHSSTVLYENKGYMFLGKSGTGKSTHSQSWLRNFPGCELMNDDNPIIRITDEGVFVYGSPWSGKTPCYKQLKAPVGALVSLVQAKHNKIRKLDNVKGFVSIFSSVSTLMCHGESYQSILSTMLRLAELVPVYELENLPDDDAAKLCKSTVVCP